jgi:hypothetical protein
VATKIEGHELEDESSMLVTPFEDFFVKRRTPEVVSFTFNVKSSTSSTPKIFRLSDTFSPLFLEPPLRNPWMPCPRG